MTEGLTLKEGLTGQEHAGRVLATVIKNGRSSHAYLFAGPRGTGKLEAALKFAAALCCREGGCGVCDSCLKAAAGTHPDIEVIGPVGSFITVDQIREINRSLNLRPSESRARVFIISNADAFNAESANAFLKSLEEPPSFVCFILLSDGAGRVLPTIVSRCQAVRFESIAPGIIEKNLQDDFDLSEPVAKALARVSSGNLSLARALAGDSELKERRDTYIQMGMSLVKGDVDAGALVARLLAIADAAAEEAGASEEKQAPEGFSSSAEKQRQKDAHRRASAARREEVGNALGFLQLWFRDMMVSAAGAGEAAVNKDYELELEHQALPSQMENYRQALSVVEAARAKLGYNIDLELALRAMFYQLQEVL